MDCEPLSAFPRQVARSAASGLRRRLTRTGIAVGSAVTGWALMWAQALDLAPLPAWPGLALFGFGLALIPTLPGAARTQAAAPARKAQAVCVASPGGRRTVLGREPNEDTIGDELAPGPAGLLRLRLAMKGQAVRGSPGRVRG